MGYIDEYRKRTGKCEFCKHHDTDCFSECYGGAFEDKLDLYQYIRNRVTEESYDKFNKTEDGKRLLQMMKQHEDSYYDTKQSYERERDNFLEKELKRIDETINSI